jgi:hypothetical protein
MPACRSDPHRPGGRIISYHENAKTVEAASSTYKPEQHCGNCLQLTGNEGDAWRPCNLFTGKLVSGLVQVYVKP